MLIIKQIIRIIPGTRITNAWSIFKKFLSQQGNVLSTNMDSKMQVALISWRFQATSLLRAMQHGKYENYYATILIQGK